MTDKVFTKRLRELTDDAIRESLAEISVEFEKRFGPALTASPPVVEREAGELVGKLEWALNGYRLAEERLRLIPTLATAMSCAVEITDINAKLGELLPEIILALTPVEGVGERAARTEYGWLIERDGHGGLRYATPRSWTADHMKALRFARKVDAEEFAASHQDWSTDIRITEHAWD